MMPKADDLLVTNFLPSVQVLTGRLYRTHRGLLLEGELELDREIGRSEAAWKEVRSAALDGWLADIPVAREALAAWKGVVL